MEIAKARRDYSSMRSSARSSTTSRSRRINGSERNLMKLRSLILGGVALPAALSFGPARYHAPEPGTGDWPMWGGTPDRNMVSNMKGLPTEWDIKTKKNVKWVAKLGSQSYGNPV